RRKLLTTRPLPASAARNAATVSGDACSTPPVRGTPIGETGDRGAVGPPCIVGPRGAPLIGGRDFCLGEARGRRRQVDDRLEVEPFAHVVRLRPWSEVPRACRPWPPAPPR